MGPEGDGHWYCHAVGDVSEGCAESGARSLKEGGIECSTLYLMQQPQF